VLLELSFQFGQPLQRRHHPGGIGRKAEAEALPTPAGFAVLPRKRTPQAEPAATDLEAPGPPLGRQSGILGPKSPIQGVDSQGMVSVAQGSLPDLWCGPYRDRGRPTSGERHAIGPWRYALP